MASDRKVQVKDYTLVMRLDRQLSLHDAFSQKKKKKKQKKKMKNRGGRIKNKQTRESKGVCVRGLGIPPPGSIHR